MILGKEAALFGDLALPTDDHGIHPHNNTKPKIFNSLADLLLLAFQLTKPLLAPLAGTGGAYGDGDAWSSTHVTQASRGLVAVDSAVPELATVPAAWPRKSRPVDGLRRISSDDGSGSGTHSVGVSICTATRLSPEAEQAGPLFQHLRGWQRRHLPTGL